MSILGGIIGGIGSAAAGIIGGKAARKAAKRNAALIAEAENDARAWYEKEYNRNFLDRSDARAAINEARTILNDRYKQADASAAVTGATEDSVAREKAAANEALAEITSNIAERADAHKDAVRANYETQKDAFLQQKIGVNNQKAEATMSAAKGLADAAKGLGGALGNMGLDDKLSKVFK